MKTITAHFETVDFADLASGRLRRELGITNITLKSTIRDDGDEVVNYPIKPEYLEPSHTQYLEGMPHVLSNGPIFTPYDELAERRDAVLTFAVEDNHEQVALSIVMKYGGHSVKVRN